MSNIMPTYEQLDILCDAINPVLFLLASIQAFYYWVLLPGAKLGITRLRPCIFFGIALIIVYALKAIDTQLKIWALFSSDYSTHTAFALATATALFRQQRYWAWYVIVAIYALLMQYQNYHTFTDIVSTAAVIFVLLKLVGKCPRLRCKPPS